MDCPVCLEVFQTPLLLPGCGHTICRSCAELMLTEGNYLRCPECRLVYQLRKGIQSLPKNVALQRTIDEHKRGNSNNIKCSEHPDDTVTLYCKTCEKSICLKCFFSNTLRKGQSMHSGHQVDTSEDTFTKELRLLDEQLKSGEERRVKEKDYVSSLEVAETKLQDLLAIKLTEIENQKNKIIATVKQTAAKLKFTLQGSVSRDQESLQAALQSSRGRQEALETQVTNGNHTLYKATSDLPEINEIKEARKRLESLPEVSELDRPEPDTFLKVERFDTDLQSCITDPKLALSYQTERPRTPNLSENDIIVSNNCAYLQLHYNEAVRVKQLVVCYKEAMYKGFSEKSWTRVEVSNFSGGIARHVLTDLEKGTMYRMFFVASNEFGDSAQSNELWFRTPDAEIEKRIT